MDPYKHRHMGRNPYPHFVLGVFSVATTKHSSRLNTSSIWASPEYPTATAYGDVWGLVRYLFRSPFLEKV